MLLFIFINFHVQIMSMMIFDIIIDIITVFCFLYILIILHTVHVLINNDNNIMMRKNNIIAV